jgi:ATP-dependent helicase/nuclease subunit B
MSTQIPNVSSIPVQASFIDALARLLLKDLPGLAHTYVFLPNHRSCRLLVEALCQRAPGGALIMPKMLSLGDLDPDEVDLSLDMMHLAEDVEGKPISSYARLGILMSLLKPHYEAITYNNHTLPPVQLIQVAEQLARLTDQAAWENLSFDNLQDIVHEDYAKHWQITLDFLDIITKEWPKLLKELNLTDVVEYRRRLLLSLANQWQNSPPHFPIIAAGSTGSIPVTAELLQVIAQLPEGKVVLPGLDFHLQEEQWDSLGITHPQYGMRELLKRMGMAREDVREEEMDSPQRANARSQFSSCAMQPAEGGNWSLPQDILAHTIEGWLHLDCASHDEEATVIALKIREVVARGDQQVTLVTPDQRLATLVTEGLKRWGIVADNSAGARLDVQPCGVFLNLLARVLCVQRDPTILLSFLKHPLFAMDHETLNWVYDFEMKMLRGRNPKDHYNNWMNAYLQEQPNERVRQFSELLASVTYQNTQLFSVTNAKHLEIAGTLVPDIFDNSDMQDFLNSLKEGVEYFPEIALQDYGDVFSYLMKQATVREAIGHHPQVRIMGPLEARLLKPDVVILGGLNEGTWPATAEPDPWLSRPMRRDFGLPLPERRVGLSAHDFVQCFCAPEVITTRSIRVDGSPTLPSRWLQRMDAVLKTGGMRLQDLSSSYLKDWSQILDKPERIQKCERPAPRPPLEARPQKLSVTQIEKWMRDPYAIYAQKILKLAALDPLKMDVSAAQKGSWLHKVLEVFVQKVQANMIPFNKESLLDIGDQIWNQMFGATPFHPYLRQRFARSADWFLNAYSANRPRNSYLEVSGAMTLESGFVVTAKADRIDLMPDNVCRLIDYKTGSPPPLKQMVEGIACQLPLEAAIIQAGGFTDVPIPCAVNSLEYWQLSGGSPAGKQRIVQDNTAALITKTVLRVEELVAQYQNPDMPYIAKTGLKYNDYEHLERVSEWSR